MLARDYGYERVQEPEQNTREFHFIDLKKNMEQERDVFVRSCILVIITMLMATYAISVFRSTTKMAVGNSLLSMQSQELQLIESNKLLKLEVEQLKSPERVIGFAEKTLGLSTARSNIYVYPTNVKEMNNTTYALSNK